MGQEHQLVFGPFRLDPVKHQLWRNEQAIELQPRPLAVLHYLAARPGQVVTKEELLKGVWQGTYVTKTALKVSVRAIRKALGDDANNPQYLETVGWEGYRFIEKGVSPQSPVVSSDKTKNPQLATSNRQLTTHLVGRETELTQLHEWLAKALNGERQVVFVTGEPGIGKTTLVDAFLQSLEPRDLGSEESQNAKIGNPSLAPNPQPLTPVFIGRGQCLEQYGEGEPYLPVLEALGQMCRESDGAHVVAVLAQYAPTWLVQMPALVSAEELEAIQRKVAGATRERMLREMAEALEALTTARALVLVLEDLHWSDHSTLELIAYLARRRAPARLLVLGTYRPADVVLRKHPLREIKQELHVHGQCGELRLELLMEENVAEYVDERFAGEEREFAPELARLVYRRTDGNALFMVNLVNELVTRHVIVQQEGRWELARPLADIEIGLPSSLRRFLEQQLDRLSPTEREMLEAASVVGMGFSAAGVSAALETETTQVEERCTDLARREHFLRHCGVVEWPGDTVTSCYRFTHALYQEVLYEQIPLGRRVELHRRIGEREEHAYGAHAGEVAAELAMHFERGRDYSRAVHYLHRAGENAIRRNAYREAMLHLTHGLELLTHLPDTPERARQELSLQVALSLPLMATKTPAAAEVEKVYRRARDLCEQVGETRELFPALWNLWSCYEARAQWRTARDLAQQLLIMAQDAQDPALLLQAHHAQWTTLINLGELITAHAHCEQGIALYDPRQYRSQIFLCGGHDPGVCCREMSSLPLWLLGYPDQALKRSYEALTLGQELSHPLSLVGALDRAAMLHQWRGEEQAVETVAEAAIARSTELGFVFHLTFETVLRGWILARRGRDQGGIAQIQQSLAARRASGVEVNRPYCLALLAEGYGKVGQAEKGLTALAEALDVVHKTGERFYEAELYRLKGELTLQQTKQKSKGKSQKSKIKTSPQPLAPSTQEAEACFLKAIEVARQQQARSLELRATTSLARLWQQQGKREDAHQMLAKIYGWFTEGFDTKDLQEAKALLAELSH